MQSSTTPDPGYQWESDKLTVDTTNESQKVSPFPINSIKHKHSMTRNNLYSDRFAQSDLSIFSRLKEVPFEDFDKLELCNYSWIHFEVRPQPPGQ